MTPAEKVARKLIKDLQGIDFLLNYSEAEEKEAVKLVIVKLNSFADEKIEACANELERAFEECDTLNLLHGAARIRGLKSNQSGDK